MCIRYYNVVLSRSEGHRVIGVSCHVLPSLKKVSYFLLTSYVVFVDRIVLQTISRVENDAVFLSIPIRSRTLGLRFDS